MKYLFFDAFGATRHEQRVASGLDQAPAKVGTFGFRVHTEPTRLLSMPQVVPQEERLPLLARYHGVHFDDASSAASGDPRISVLLRGTGPAQ